MLHAMATFCVCTNSNSNTLLVFITCTAVAHVKALPSLCAMPVAQPLWRRVSVQPQWLLHSHLVSCMKGSIQLIQQPSSCWLLCVLPLSGPYENDLKLHLTLATGQGQGQPHLSLSHTHTQRNYSMQQSSSWEANQFTTSQDIPSVLRNPMVPYHIYKSPPPVPTLSHTNQGNNY